MSGADCTVITWRRWWRWWDGGMIGEGGAAAPAGQWRRRHRSGTQRASRGAVRCRQGTRAACTRCTITFHSSRGGGIARRAWLAVAPVACYANLTARGFAFFYVDSENDNENPRTIFCMKSIIFPKKKHLCSFIFVKNWIFVIWGDSI